MDGYSIKPVDQSELKSWVEDDSILSQLANKDIEVNFINRGDVDNYKYLSIEPQKDYVNLWDKDDSSGRQRWRLRKAYSNSYYLTSSGNKYGLHYLWGQYKSKCPDGYPRMYNREIGTFTISPIKNTDYYTLFINGGSNGASSWIDDQTLVVASNGYNTHYVFFLKYGSTNRKNWEIKPVENFVIKNGGAIKYVMEGTDKIDVIPSYIDEVVITNRSTVTQTMTASYSNRASSTSSHSRQHGITIGVSSTLKVGVPVISEGQLTTSISQSNQWSYTESETKEDSRSYSFPVSVPAQTKIVVKIIVAQYRANLTYTIDAISESSGKSLTVKGKWNGVTLGKVSYEITPYTLEGGVKGQTKRFIDVPKTVVNM